MKKSDAGYMELAGAKQDAACKKVDGPVSAKLGCCNLYQPQSSRVQEFRCGVCEYIKPVKDGKFYG